MDEFVRKNGAVRNQYGVLGGDGNYSSYCNLNECNILEYGADRKIKDKIFPSKIRK
jgi:hypothetical protein